jgi:phage portal protein BeeE
VGLFLGRETRGWIPEPPIAPFPGADMGGFVNTSSKPDTALQVPTVWACINLIAGAISSMQLETFRRQSDPSAVPQRLPDPKLITQEQARTMKDRVMATFRGREPLVLGLGLRYTQIQVKPEESQFLATQQANVAQICRYFGVPAAMVDGPSGGGMQYSNTEQRSIEFLTYTLAHWLRRIEDAVSALLPNGQFVKFNTHSLLRLDAETQAKVDLQRLAGKIVAPSEIRARDGLDPMTDAQKKEADMVPLTVGPLGRPVGQPALHEPVGPEAPVPGVENPTGA